MADEERMASLKEKKRKFDLIREDRSYSGAAKRPTPPVLKTKAASTLKTVADEPRGLMSKSTPVKPVKKSSIKGLMDKAMSRYKKTDKVGMGGRSVSKEKGLFTRTVDGKDQMVREKTKTVTKADGTVKKTVTKGKGVMGSNIGRYKDVKRFK